MSNNHFLKSKENNRFRFLNDDDNRDNKKSSSNKNIVEYNPTNNSFTQEFNHYKHRNNDRRDNNRRDNDRRNNDRRDNYTTDSNQNYNRFKSCVTQEKKQQNNIDFGNTEEFPELFNNKKHNTNNSNNINESSKFKDILTNVIEDNNTNKISQIPAGWLQLSIVNKKTVTKNGPLTQHLIDIEKQKELENDINYNMSIIVKSIQKNYEVNKQVYDSINGEGAYDERFRLSPVYGSEYDSESDSYDDVNDVNDVNDDNYDEYN